jgi:V8-like Glu-specific endopeptidase
MRNRVFGIVLSIVLLLAIVIPVLAITDGEEDGDLHPYVGIMVAQDADGNPLWRCSGTLLSSKVFLTAGHCTEPPAAHVEIWFDADVENGIPKNGYPFKGDASGTPYTHPQYNPNAFFLYDLGVVVLKGKGFVTSKYGELPTEDYLDELVAQYGKSNITFTAVGYGLQKSFPDAAAWKDVAYRIRMVAYPNWRDLFRRLRGAKLHR